MKTESNQIYAGGFVKVFYPMMTLSTALEIRQVLEHPKNAFEPTPNPRTHSLHSALNSAVYLLKLVT